MKLHITDFEDVKQNLFKLEVPNGVQKRNLKRHRTHDELIPISKKLKRSIQLKDGIYEGEMAEDTRYGFGIFYYENGDKYEGEWKDDKPHGKGILMYRENEERERESYRGEFNDGEINGFGVMIWKNGTRYEGDFKNGKRNGKGKILNSNGSTYDGDWLDNQKHGRGIFVYSKLNQKDRYDGEWQFDKVHGNGVLYMKNGVTHKASQNSSQNKDN